MDGGVYHRDYHSRVIVTGVVTVRVGRERATRTVGQWAGGRPGRALLRPRGAETRAARPRVATRCSALRCAVLGLPSPSAGAAAGRPDCPAAGRPPDRRLA